MVISRKSLWSTLLFLLLSLLIVSGISAAFQDTDGHWAEDAIAKWNEYGVVNGYEGLFRPNDEITRAEFSVMIDNIMKYIEQGENHFSDLDASAWYTDAMLRLNKAGVMMGADGKAMPQNNITRQEAALMIAKAFQITAEDNKAPSFTDDDDIAPWAKDAVYALVAHNVIQGMPDGTFQPRENLTRAQAVTMFNQFIAVLVNKKGEFSEDVSGNVVVNTPDVTLKNLTIDGDLYVAQGVDEGDLTLDNVTINGSMFVYGGGENSILFNNVDVKGALVVNKYNGKVRIVATGNSSVQVTLLESGAILVTRELTGGGFETVEISANIVAGQAIVLDGTFNKVVNYSEAVTITANGTIKELVSEVNTNIEGDVKIEKLTEKDGVETTLDGRKLDSSSLNRSSGGGGYTGGGGGRSSRNVAVTGVTINEANIYLVIGESKQLTATIEPSNATNKKVSWKVKDGSDDVVTVNEEGVVTAISVGTKTVQVVTDDGGKTDEVVVHVNKPPFNISLTPFTASIADAETAVDENILKNSEALSITEVQQILHKTNTVESLLIAQDDRLKTSDPEGYFTYVVITLNNIEEEPLSDTTGIQTSVTDAVYSHVGNFGDGLNDAFKTGSFILKFDMEQPEVIRTIDITFAHEDYADTTLTLVYIPKGKAYATKMEAISGEPTVGAVLTAGKVNYEGDPADDQLTYIWVRSESENGPYTIIDGANNSTYEVTEEDSGKYIRAIAITDHVHAGGTVASDPFGPIEKWVDASEVFAAIEAQFLADNTDGNQITSNLNLMTSLSEFPGVSISWTSSDENVITNDGKVTRRDRGDQTVYLTATLSGSVIGSKIKTYALTVRAMGTDPVEDEGFIDPYFKDNYPQAYVKDDTIWVRFQLEKPAEVYMIVNASNGYWESDVNAVLEGRAGLGDDIIWVDDWPYFNVTDPEQLYEFDTEVELGKYGPARIEFVIVDKEANYTSNAVTTIKIDPEAYDEEDPDFSYLAAYMNNTFDEIYVYYYEKLDLTSVPKASDFTLNVGKVESVSLHNYEGQYSFPGSYVKLSISGVTEQVINDINSLILSYQGDALQEQSNTDNKARPFTDLYVSYNEGRINSAYLSYDKKTVLVEIYPGYNIDEYYSMPNFDDLSRFSIHVEGRKETYQPSNLYVTSSGIYGLSFQLEFAEPLPDGKKKLTFDTTDIMNWAMDPYPKPLSFDDIIELSQLGIPTAEYTPHNGRIKLTFAEGSDIKYASFVGGFVLSIDGVEYHLRGFIGSILYKDNSRNNMIIDLHTKYAEHVKEAMDAGNDIQIQYVKQDGDSYYVIKDVSGAHLPSFDYVPVTKLP